VTPPSPLSRTKWTRLVHPSVLIGHVSRRCDANGTHVVVWSGSKAEVFDLDAQGGFARSAEFESRATEMAIGSDRHGAVEVHLYQAVEVPPPPPRPPPRLLP